MKLIWILNRWLLHIALILFSGFSFSQDDHELYNHKLDESKWEDIRDGIRYEGGEQGQGPGRRWTYESEEDYRRAEKQYGEGSSGSGNSGGNGGWGEGDGANAPERDYDYSPPPDAPDVDISTSGLGFFGYILLAILVIALIAMIYYMYLNSPKDGTKVPAIVDLDEANPSEIPLTELQRLLNEALAKGDYRGAVRVYFIFIIRGLADRRWIKWEKEKTNFHYLREMSGKDEFEDFNRSVSFFEIIWYGKRDIDQNKFEEIKPNFTRFLDKLGVQ